MSRSIFEKASNVDGLRRSGFDLARPAVISWLGVTLCLTRQAIGQVLDELIVDHLLPASLRDEAGRLHAD